MFETILSEHNKIWGAQKRFGVTAPYAAPCLRAWVEPSPESLPLGPRYSENWFLSHNMNSICRLCKLIIHIFPKTH